MLKNPTLNTLTVKVPLPGEDRIPKFYRMINLPEGRISDILPGEEAHWNRANPILLNTPPGSGKSTWVRKYLIPLAAEQSRNLIWVSNRTASSCQMKTDLMRDSKDPRLKFLREEGIRQTEDFGHVRILTTQSLPTLLNDPSLRAWLNNVGYVVIDECHIFTSDAMFNENCDWYLKLITERFRHAIRIYMSGTVDDVLVPLAKAEAENFRYNVFPPQWQPPREFLWYRQPANFAPYQLEFVDSLDSLIPRISANPSAKWITFTDSKNVGKAFADKLSSVWYVDASRKSGERWDLLVDKERFKEQVLVATAVLDSGVNIHDDAVKNIAITADNPATLIQMLGRRRLDPGDKLNVYVVEPNREKIEHRLRLCQEYLGWYDLFNATLNPDMKLRFADTIWRSGDPQLLKLFHISKGRVYSNELAYHVLLRRRYFYQRIVSGETTFRREVEHWLEKPPSPCKVVSDEVLDEFCQPLLGHRLNSQQWEQLKELVFALCKNRDLDPPAENRKEKVTHVTINNRLVDMALPYEVISVGKQEWLLCCRNNANSTTS